MRSTLLASMIATRPDMSCIVAPALDGALRVKATTVVGIIGPPKDKGSTTLRDGACPGEHGLELEARRTIENEPDMLSLRQWGCNEHRFLIGGSRETGRGHERNRSGQIRRMGGFHHAADEHER